MDVQRGQTRPMLSLPIPARAASSPPTSRRPPEAQYAADTRPTSGFIPTSQPTQENSILGQEIQPRDPLPRDYPRLQSQGNNPAEHEPVETQQPLASETSDSTNRKFWSRSRSSDASESSDASDTDDADDVFHSPLTRRHHKTPPLANFIKSLQDNFETPRRKRRKRNGRNAWHSSGAPLPPPAPLAFRNSGIDPPLLRWNKPT